MLFITKTVLKFLYNYSGGNLQKDNVFYFTNVYIEMEKNNVHL